MKTLTVLREEGHALYSRVRVGKEINCTFLVNLGAEYSSMKD